MPVRFTPTLACLFAAAVLFFAGAARADERPVRPEAFFFEAGIGGSGLMQDDYIDRLESFRFETPGDLVFDDGFERFSHTQSIGYMLHENFGLLLRHELLEQREFVRYLIDAQQDEFGWTSRAFSIGLRGRMPFVREWFAFYGQANVGLGIARSTYQNYGQKKDRETDLGLSFGLLVGLDLNFFKYGGMFVETGYTHAPLLENRFGETHNDGGLGMHVGFRVRTFGEP